jgi:hypothetical protein
MVCAGLVTTSVILLPWFFNGVGHSRLALEDREIFAEVHDLRREITLLNLINGLYLSPEQMAQMLEVSKKAQGIRENFRSEAISQAGEMESILKRIRETLVQSEEINGELVRKFRRSKKRLEDLKEELHGSLLSCQDEMKMVLNENQLALIEEFRPCIIPPRDTRNPTRIGQVSGDTSMGERLLTRVRQMDERMYLKRKPVLIERYIERVERHVGVLSEEERAEEEGRVVALFKRAREISDMDFEAQKENLARELKEPHEKVLQSRWRKRKGDLDKLGRFLLDPNLIPILESRLTRVTAR